MVEKLASRVAVCGHYGAGKTNLTVNLALEATQKGEKVTVVDMDVVNPYFRTADFEGLFSEHGVKLISPVYANTNLDLPVLPPSVASVIRSGERVFLDVGGDDDGAVALGGFSGLLEEKGYTMLYVVNRCRELDPNPAEEAELIRRVQQASRLKATFLVNNTNLGKETTPQLLEQSEDYMEALSRLTGLPVLFRTADKQIADTAPEKEGVVPIEIYVKPPWEAR